MTSRGGVKAPIAVGGVGGSGTRVIASILNSAGVYLGNDLNESMDNLWFTILFKDRGVYDRVREEDAFGRRSLALFEKLMTGSESLAAWDLQRIVRSTARVLLHGHNHLRHGHGRWALQRLGSILAARRTSVAVSRWGWKEPCTYVYADLLPRYYPGATYVHVIRNGLDMAHSTNVQDLYLWGPLFGVEAPVDESRTPLALLRYWIAANDRVIQSTRSLFGDSFVLVRFEELCKRPRSVITDLLARLDLSGDVWDLATRVRSPSSVGRHRRQTIAGATDADLAAVRRFGYDP